MNILILASTHMFHKILMSSLLFLGLLLSMSSSYAASIAGTLSIKESELRFIDFSRYSEVEELFDTGELIIDFESQTQTKLNKNGKVLQFESPNGDHSGTGVISVAYKNIQRKILVDINIKQESTTSLISQRSSSDFSNIKDYNIFSKMPYHRLQERSLSCESSATSDVLSYLMSSKVTELSVIEKLGKSDFYNKLPVKRDVGTVWGNPNKGFVGYINSTSGVTAKQKLMTGYGVYEAPIAGVYNDYGFKTNIINGENHTENYGETEQLTQILTELASGNMVQLWGDWCTIPKYEDGDISNLSITNSKARNGEISGKNECYNVLQDRTLNWSYVNEVGEYISHEGLDGQHAFILLGWKGDITNPSHVRVWDTNTGYHEYQTIEWLRKWKAMDYRTVIIESIQKSKT
ncbi:hypothetical protein GW846_02225 [Candidatus Gracilibacteria bacterium]|nr:hypothetical protein [Candidatus Gracilibacteria bacterium]